MGTIRPIRSQNSLHSEQSIPTSRETIDKEELVDNSAREEREAFMSDSDTESNFQDDNRQAEHASSTSLASLESDSPSAAGKGVSLNNSRSRRSSRIVSFSGSEQGTKHQTHDGSDFRLVSLNTQTDWGWVEKVQDTGKAKIIVPTKEDSNRASASDGNSKSVLVKPESRETTSQPKPEQGGRSAADREADYTPFSFHPNDEFGIPLLDISSESDDSSGDEVPKKKKAPPRVTLPSVGPPQILKYVRESEMSANVSEAKTPATPETIESDLPCDESGNPMGIFSGPCEFCGKTIYPLPTVEMQQIQDPANLYCCEDYRDFIEFAAATTLRMEQEAHKAMKTISVKVHPHHGSKQARKAAKEKAVERMRQRQLARRQQESLGSQANFYSAILPGLRGNLGSQGVGSGHDSYAGAHEARQMKTINYQLSSQRCLEEGWTLRVPSPLLAEDSDTEVFIPEPLHPAMIASGNIRDRPMIEKFYPNGAKFLTVFPDGTGNIFYPSGLLAILISSISLGQYTYIVFDSSSDSRVLAIFDPSGFGSIYFPSGNIRLYYDQYAGIQLDSTGAKKKRWSWLDQETHVHAPPFQPICMRLNDNNSVRVMSQEAIALTFMASKRSCRFNVGARLKLVAPQLLPRKAVDEHQLYISEQTAQVENILSKVSMLLKFPNSPKVDKILPPLHITCKMKRNEKLRKELSNSVRTSTENKLSKDKKIAFPVVSVN